MAKVIYDDIQRTGEHLVSEIEPNLCRKKVVLETGMKYPAGTVLGLVTASDEYAEYDPTATDGRETVAGVLFAAVDATSASKPGVMHHALTVMLESKLNWKATLSDDSTMTDAQKAAAITALSARHIEMALESGLA